jgi:L-threonylcarbamoyladenylate synthase
VESTVVLLAAGQAVLLRPGGTPVEAIESVIGPLGHLPEDDPASAALAPGRSGAHYAPATTLEIVDPSAPDPSGRLRARPGERVGLLAMSAAGAAAARARGGPFAAEVVLDPSGDLVGVAARLFDALHDLEMRGLDRIVAQPVAPVGLGRAVMDRLRRAALADAPRHPTGAGGVRRDRA